MLIPYFSIPAFTPIIEYASRERFLDELFDSGLTRPVRFAELLRLASASAAFLAHCNWVERTDKLAWEMEYRGRIPLNRSRISFLYPEFRDRKPINEDQAFLKVDPNHLELKEKVLALVAQQDLKEWVKVLDAFQKEFFINIDPIWMWESSRPILLVQYLTKDPFYITKFENDSILKRLFEQRTENICFAVRGKFAIEQRVVKRYVTINNVQVEFLLVRDENPARVPVPEGIYTKGPILAELDDL